MKLQAAANFPATPRYPAAMAWPYPLHSCDGTGRGQPDRTRLPRVHPPTTQNPSQCTQRHSVTFLLSAYMQCQHAAGAQSSDAGQQRLPNRLHLARRSPGNAAISEVSANTLGDVQMEGTPQDLVTGIKSERRKQERTSRQRCQNTAHAQESCFPPSVLGRMWFQIAFVGNLV